MKKFIAIILLLATTSCMSLQTRKKIVEDQVQMHPEWADINFKLKIIDERMDRLFEKMNVVEEAHRDDTEMVISYLRSQIDEIKKELMKK